MSLAIIAPGWIEEQRRHLAHVAIAPNSQVAQVRDGVRSITAALGRFQEILLTDDREEAIAPLWDFVRDSIQTLVDLRTSNRRNLAGVGGWFVIPSEVREYVSAADTLLERFIELARTVLISRPELNLTLPADLEEVVWTVRISPFAYLRAMWNLFWSAIRHPLSETTIDLSTGRVLYRT